MEVVGSVLAALFTEIVEVDKGVVDTMMFFPVILKNRFSKRSVVSLLKTPKKKAFPAFRSNLGLPLAPLRSTFHMNCVKPIISPNNHEHI